jgi:uncharacterized membrane protein
MTILIVGLILFFAVHAIPLSQTARASIVLRLGENGFKGMFSLISIAGFAAIVVGMKNAPFEPLWSTPTSAARLANLTMPVAFCLLAAAYVPNNFRRIVRNPMLSATLLWSLAHLLSNGDLASLMLFGSFGLFAIVDIVAVNRLSSATNVQRKPLYFDVLTVSIGLLAFWAVRHYHGALFGTPVAY